MDEISLLRRVRNEIPERAPGDIARGRAELFAHIDGEVIREANSDRRRRLMAAWVGASALTAAVVTVVLVIAPNALSGNDETGAIVAEPGDVPTTTTESMALASAATVLKTAAAATLGSSDPAVGPGQYLLVQTTAVYLTQGAIEEDRPKIEANGGTIEEEDLVSYLEGARDDVYIPANRDDEWVWVRYTRTPAETFGPRSEALVRESLVVFPDQTLRLPGGAFDGGSTVDSYYVGTEPVRGYDALPRDPQQLLATIYELTVGMGPSPDGQALAWIADRLRSGTVPADLRAAFYEAAAKIPGVTITEQQATLDGTTGTAIGRDEDANGFRQDIIIEPTTGQFIGERTVLLKGYGDVPAGTVMNSTSVTTTVVDSAP